MNFFSTIVSGVVGLAKGLFGGGSGGSNQNVITTLAEKILPETAKEKAAAVIASEDEGIKDVDSARAYEAPDTKMVQYTPGMGMIPFFLMWTLDATSRMVDLVNHMVRPGTLIWLVGGFMGKWKLPDPKVVDPQLWTVFLIVVTFFFGARTLVTDVPALIAAIKK